MPSQILVRAEDHASIASVFILLVGSCGFWQYAVTTMYPIVIQLEAGKVYNSLLANTQLQRRCARHPRCRVQPCAYLSSRLKWDLLLQMEGVERVRDLCQIKIGVSQPCVFSSHAVCLDPPSSHLLLLHTHRYYVVSISLLFLYALDFLAATCSMGITVAIRRLPTDCEARHVTRALRQLADTNGCTYSLGPILEVPFTHSPEIDYRATTLTVSGAKKKSFVSSLQGYEISSDTQISRIEVDEQFYGVTPLAEAGSSTFEYQYGPCSFTESMSDSGPSL